MMGPRQEAQAAQFCGPSLLEYVPREHLLRSIDRFVDPRAIHVHLKDYYSHTGRPSVDPEQLMFETTVARSIKEGLVTGQQPPCPRDSTIIQTRVAARIFRQYPDEAAV